MLVAHWLGQLYQRSFRRAFGFAPSTHRERRRLSSAPVRVEFLERRMCLTAVAWDGGGDGIHWSDPANWQADVLPTENDDVSISIGVQTILHEGGVHSIKSLTTSNPLEISGGTLAIATTFAINNTVTLSGGAIQDATITEIAGDLMLTPAGGTLDRVTLNGSLDLTTFRASATIRNGLTLNGTASFGPDALLFFAGTQSLEGNATVVFRDQPGATNGLVASTDGMTLTIGEHITLRGGNTDFGGTTIGYNQFVAGGTNTSIVNNGTIIPDVAGGHIVIRPRGTGTFTNHGSIDLQGGTLDLNGYLTPATVGNLTRTSGAINLFGTLDLEGATLNLANVGGTWNVRGGTVLDGTINESAGALLLLTGNGGTLDGVTLNGPLEMTEFRANATIKNGFTLNGTATMGRDALLFFSGTQTLAGEATFNFQNVPGATNGLVASADGMTLTIGEHIILRGGNSDEGGTTIGYNPFAAGGTNTSIVNRGTIIADTVGGRFVIRPRGTGTFTNAGHISLEGGTLDLDADVTPASLGNLTRTAGGIRLFRTLDLTGLTLNLADLGGPWTLRGGTIKGGVVNLSGAGKLLLSPAGGVLNGVTLNGSLEMTEFRTNATIQNGFTLNGTARLGADALLFFEGTQTLSGQAEFIFEDVPGATNGLVAREDNMTLTIGPNVTLSGGNSDFGAATIGYNQFTSGGTNTTIVNQGTIDASTAGGRILIKPRGTGTFSNSGNIFVRDNATLEITTSLAIPDPANVSVSATGSLRLGGDLLMANHDQGSFPGAFQFNGSGTAQVPQLFELRSQNLGTSHQAFFGNFAITSLGLANGTYVKLVDQFDNAPGVEPEALYAKSIVIPAGTTLDLNGLSVYTTSLQQAGVVINGSIIQIAPIPSLTLGQTVTGTLAVGQTVYYQVDISTGLEPEFLLNGLPATGIVEMYVSRDELPTRDRFDWSSTQPFTTEQSVTLPPLSSAGTYYILLYTPTLANSPANFQLNVSAPIFSVRTTNFGHAGNRGDFTLKALGANFDSGVTVRLTKTPGFQLLAKSYVSTETELYPTFDLNGVAPGTYNVVFINKNGVTVTIPNSLTVEASSAAAAIIPHIVAPSAIRRGREFSFIVEWTNTSLNDVVAPLITVGSTVPFGLDHNDYSLGSRYTFLGTNTQGGPAGILRPGQTESLTFWSYSDSEPGEYTVFVDRDGKDRAASFDWDSLRSSLLPFGMTDAEFEPLFHQLVTQVGGTWGDYLDMLSKNARLLPPGLGDSHNPLALVALELRFAMSALSTSLTGTIDFDDHLASTVGLEIGALNLTDGTRYSTQLLNDRTFRFSDLTPGQYSIVVPGYVIMNLPAGGLSLSQNQHLSDLEVTISRGAELTFEVLDQSTNQVVSGALASLYDGTTVVAGGLSDSLGRISISGLSNGIVQGFVDAENYARVYLNSLSPSDTSNTHTIRLSAESIITLTVMPVGGTSADDAIIIATRRDTAVAASFFAFPVANGTFEIRGLPSGIYDLTLASSGAAAKTIEGVVLGRGETSNLGTVQLDPAPAALVSDGGVVSAAGVADFISEQALNLIEDIVRAKFAYLPVERGLEYTNVAFAYLDNVPYVRRIYQFTDGFETVEGVSYLGVQVNPGFRHHPVTESNFLIAYDAALAELERRISAGEIQPGNICNPSQSAGAVYTLADLLFPSSPELLFVSADAPGPVPFNWNFARTLAGGLGYGGTPPDALVPDYRSISGEFVVTAAGPGKVRVEARNFAMQVGDTFDFYPGSPGGPILEFLITKDLRFLEMHGRAFDIGLVIAWKHQDPLPSVVISFPGIECDPKDPHIPADSSVVIKRPVSFDPNDITGPAGVGPLNHIVPDELMPYTIHFENAASAGAPAANVVVTQQLDSDLDWTTFRLGDLGFGETIVDVPANTASFQARVDLRETRGVYVDITAGINVGTGVIRWEFVSIDPLTGLPPENPLVGFLPPNVAGPQGEGFLNYTIRAKSTVVTGDRIDAVAPIVFDVNDPILTPSIFHTIDRVSPSSHVTPMNATSDLTFTVNWEGIDDSGGSGIATYDIFVSDNGSSYTLMLDDTATSSFQFTGTAGHTYAFYSVATDAVGLREAIPQVADTSTTVAGSINHNPTVIGTAFVLNENSPLNTLVGTVGASDPDGDSLTFSIIDGNPSGAFAIDPLTGEITVANPAVIDFESHSSFNLSVRVVDSTGLHDGAIVGVTVVDLNEAALLDVGGSAVTWIKKHPSVNIMPLVTVTGVSGLAGGTLNLKFSMLPNSKKLFDLIQIPSFAGLGSSPGLKSENGFLTLQIQLGANATSSALQSFLREIRFSTKGRGLKSPSRSVNVMLTTVGGGASSISQTINVRKKA